MGGEPRGLGPGSAEGHSMDGGSWGLGALPRARGSGPEAGNACSQRMLSVLLRCPFVELGALLDDDRHFSGFVVHQSPDVLSTIPTRARY